MKNIQIIKLLSILLLPLSANAEICASNELNLGGFSYHFSSYSDYAKEKGYNGKNYGIGLTCHLNGVELGGVKFQDEVEIGVLKNSFRENTVYGGYGVYYPINDRFSFGVKAMIGTGYEKAQNNMGGLIAGPALAAKLKLTDKVTLNLFGIPSFSSNNKYFDGFVYAGIGLKF